MRSREPDVFSGVGAGEFEKGVELFVQGAGAEPAEGGRLDLAGPLARDAELTADLLQGGAVAAVETVAALHEVALALGEGVQ